jgi:hypothetical protein
VRVIRRVVALWSRRADKITTAEEKLVALELEIDTLRMQRDELTKISGDEKITSSKLAQELQMMVHQGREKELEIEALRDKLAVRADKKSKQTYICEWHVMCEGCLFVCLVGFDLSLTVHSA